MGAQGQELVSAPFPLSLGHSTLEASFVPALRLLQTQSLSQCLAPLFHIRVFNFRVMWRDWEESRQMVGALLEGRAHQHLVDFDCHLDDIRQDWTNQRLNTQITQWSGSTDGNA